MNRQVLILTGTCGSGKSTLAQLLADQHGWTRISEDDHWRARYHKNRGPLGSEEHRQKRLEIRREIVTQVESALSDGRPVVVDAICHEGIPDAWSDYRDLFASVGIECVVRVLHPRVEVAVERDATRPGWKAGAAGVAELWAKFNGRLFGPEALLDTSDDLPDESVLRLLESLKVPTSPPPAPTPSPLPELLLGPSNEQGEGKG